MDPGKETQELPLDRKIKTREAPSDPGEGTQEAPLDPKETQKVLQTPVGETREAPSDPGVETKDVAGLAVGSTGLKGQVVPACRKLTISDNLPPNDVIAHVALRGARRRERSNARKFSVDERGWRRGECVNVRRWGLDDFAEEGGATEADSEGHVTEAVNRQKVKNAPEMEEWRNV